MSESVVVSPSALNKKQDGSQRLKLLSSSSTTSCQPMLSLSYFSSCSFSALLLLHILHWWEDPCLAIGMMSVSPDRVQFQKGRLGLLETRLTDSKSVGYGHRHPPPHHNTHHRWSQQNWCWHQEIFYLKIILRGFMYLLILHDWIDSRFELCTIAN